MVLSELRLCREAEVERIGGPDVLAQRLLAMGFLPGVRVRAIQAAPFGDPVTYELDGWRVSLRRSEASAVSVRCLEESAS